MILYNSNNNYFNQNDHALFKLVGLIKKCTASVQKGLLTLKGCVLFASCLKMCTVSLQ